MKTQYKDRKKRPMSTPPNTADEEIKELWPGDSRELLKALHILTREGRLNQDSRRKLKQVRHLVQLIEPHLSECKTFADLGSGKSYLGFMLYDLWLREHLESELWAIEQRPELVAAAKLVASRSKFNRIHFVTSAIDRALQAESLPESFDVVTALHACDTATDEAIAFALNKNARVIALVPCCQAEVARLLEQSGEQNALWRHPHHRREFGSHLTNVLRAYLLESRGYKVRVTELIGWEHSMKNELILAEKVQHSNSLAERQLTALREKFPLPMKLWSLV